MLVSLSSDGPLHLQIYRAFREAILSGQLTPGERLPSSRSEARLLGISRNVVLQAYSQLTAEGYYGIFGRSGARTEMPGCSLCMGNQARVAENSTVVSTSTRNFPKPVSRSRSC